MASGDRSQMDFNFTESVLKGQSFDLSATRSIRQFFNQFCGRVCRSFACSRLNKEERLFRIGRQKLNKEINIFRILRTLREHKEMIKD